MKSDAKKNHKNRGGTSRLVKRITSVVLSLMLTLSLFSVGFDVGAVETTNSPTDETSIVETQSVENTANSDDKVETVDKIQKDTVDKNVVKNTTEKKTVKSVGKKSKLKTGATAKKKTGSMPIPTPPFKDGYLFKGWFWDEDNNNDTRPVNFNSITDNDENPFYAHYVKINTVEKAEADTYDVENYYDFDLTGVQIRQEMFDKNTNQLKGAGLRFVAAISEDTLEQLDSLSEIKVTSEDGYHNDVEYGFVITKTSNIKNWLSFAGRNVSEYKLMYKGTNVNGVDTTVKNSINYQGFVTNVDCTSDDYSDRAIKDHKNFDDYRLFTVVVNYENPEQQTGKIAARPYVRYYDAQGVLRTEYIEYKGTNYHGSLSTSFANVESADQEEEITGTYTEATLDKEAFHEAVPASTANSFAPTTETLTYQQVRNKPEARRIDDKTTSGMIWSYSVGNNNYRYWTNATKNYFPKNCVAFFGNYSNLSNLDITKFDSSRTTNMIGMFALNNRKFPAELNYSNSTTPLTTRDETVLSSLSSLDLSNLDTSNVTNMRGMFRHADKLTSVNLSHFNTSKVTDMSDMFCGCISLNSLDVSHLDTSNVTTMRNMFLGLKNAARTLNVSLLDTEKVTDMSSMFAQSDITNNIDLSNFYTSNVEDFSLMFFNCTQLTNLDITSFDFTSATSLNEMFCKSKNLETIYVDPEIDLPTNATGKFIFAFCDNLKGAYGSNVPSYFTIQKHAMLNDSDFIYLSRPNTSEYYTTDSTYSYENSNYDETRFCIDAPEKNGYLSVKSAPIIPKIATLDKPNFRSFILDNNNKTIIDLTKGNDGYNYNSLVEDLAHELVSQGIINEPFIDYKKIRIVELDEDDDRYWAGYGAVLKYEGSDNEYALKDGDFRRVNDRNEDTDVYLFIVNSIMYLWTNATTIKLPADSSNLFEGINIQDTTDYELWDSYRLYATDFSLFDTSDVTNMSNMFKNTKYLKLDLSGFDVSKVTNMSNMFYNCGPDDTWGYDQEIKVSNNFAEKFSQLNGYSVPNATIV